MLSSLDKKDSEISQKIASINKIFSIKKNKLWQSDSLTITTSGIHIQYACMIPFIYFEDDISIISQLQKENIISPTYILTETLLKQSSNSEFVIFDIPFTYLTNNNTSQKDKSNEESKISDMPTQLLNSQPLQHGPLPKKIATQLLEDMIHDFCIPEMNYQFSLDKEGLKVDFLDEKSIPKKTHYLNLLLQSADLSHLNIEQDFLDLYIKANKEKFKDLKITPLDKLEMIFSKYKLIPAKSDDVTQAHRYAVYHYTHSAVIHSFNNFLRGDIKYLTEISSKKGSTSDYFQSLVFYTLSTIFIVSDYLKKCPLEKDILNQKIKEEKTYRIQFHSVNEAKTVNIIKALEQATVEKTNCFLVKESSLISTSSDNILLSISKMDVINYKSTIKCIVMMFSEEHIRRIDLLSYFSEELEVLQLPSDIQYTLLGEEKNNGPFIFLDAKRVSPLNTDKNDTYVLQHALRYVSNIVKNEFKDSKPDDEDHQLSVSGYNVVQRPNHGLAHAARQAKLINEVLNYILNYSDKKTYALCKTLKENEASLYLIQIAALFLSVGRENEKSGHEDMSGYIKSRAASKKYFEDYIQQYYRNIFLVDPDLLKIYDYCRDVIEYLGSPDYLQKLGLQYKKFNNSNDLLHLIIYHVLTTSHLLETPRCLPLHIGKEILNQRLFDDIGGIILSNIHSKKALLNLWDVALSFIGVLGDRIIGNKTYQPHLFIPASTDPSIVEKMLELIKPQQVIFPLKSTKEFQDKENNEKYNEIIFYLYYYIFKNSKYPMRQTRAFLEENMIHLLDFASQHYKKLGETDKRVLDIYPFVSAIQQKTLKKIHGLIKKLWINENDFKNPNQFFVENKCVIILDKFSIKLQYNTKQIQFYIGDLGLKNPEELKSLNSLEMGVDVSSDLKNALLKQILLHEQKVIIHQLLNPYYKTLIKLACIEELNHKNHNLQLFVEYLYHLLHMKIDNYEKITSKMDNIFYVCLVEGVRCKAGIYSPTKYQNSLNIFTLSNTSHDDSKGADTQLVKKFKIG